MNIINNILLKVLKVLYGYQKRKKKKWTIRFQVQNTLSV